MLLQTFLQLNILILATPALAGWSLLPPVQSTVRVACIVWQYRAAETPAPTVTVTETRQAKRTAVVTQRLAPIPVAVSSPAPHVVLASLPAFPHAARAP